MLQKRLQNKIFLAKIIENTRVTLHRVYLTRNSSTG